ncbi:MAG: nitroreductase family protein [candidate division Zixibacteria bacterium]|nr:nitroreductase family protein [candidate division Zixibacteria bacterium]
MDSLEAIFTRRSIRKYKPDPIPEEDIETMLRAAMSAPSANNYQPWRFIIIDERTLLDAIPEFHPYSEMLKEAPLAILVCGDKTAVGHPGYVYLDCSAATQNLLISAHALGLGAVWLGMYPRKSRMDGIRKLLQLSNNLEPISLISIGYPNQEKLPANRFDKNKVCRNKWEV